MTRLLRRYGTLMGFVLILAAFSLSLPDTFPTVHNWVNITQQESMLMVVAVGMTIVMVMGDFDLSVGSMASLAGIVAAVTFPLGVPVAIAAALAAGLVGGTINGVLVSLVGIMPFVATLATLTIFSGAAFVISGGKTIFGRAIPEDFSAFAMNGLNVGGFVLPNLTIVAIVVLVIGWFLLEQTTFGRRLYAMGGNMEAARLSGVHVRTLRLVAFSLTGLAAAGAGLMYASRVASANPTQGSGLMLNAIAAVFLGTTMSEQGEPRIHATLIGVLILGVLDNGLTQLSVDSYVRQILVGLIVLLAVAASAISRRIG